MSTVLGLHLIAYSPSSKNLSVRKPLGAVATISVTCVSVSVLLLIQNYIPPIGHLLHIHLIHCVRFNFYEKQPNIHTRERKKNKRRRRKK
jgi:hypothetical protein